MQLLATPNTWISKKFGYSNKTYIHWKVSDLVMLLTNCVTCILSLCCSDLDVLPVLSTAFPDADETICVMANISCLVPYSFLIIPGIPFVFLRACIQHFHWAICYNSRICSMRVRSLSFCSLFRSFPPLFCLYQLKISSAISFPMLQYGKSSHSSAIIFTE